MCTHISCECVVVIVIVVVVVFVALKRDLESTRTKFNEVSEKLMEKTRQYQKLQVLYDLL